MILVRLKHKKYGSIDGVYQEKEGPEVAKEILKKVGYNKNIDRICFVIPSKAVCVIVVILVAFSGMFVSEMTVQTLEESKTLPNVVINADGIQTLVEGDRPNPKQIESSISLAIYSGADKNKILKNRKERDEFFSEC